MTSAPIDFYFDFSSPYGYFASLHIDKLAQQYGRQVNWHAILLGPVFKMMHISPLVDVPLKGAYSRRDIARTARFHQIAYREPDAFPIATHHAARAVLWVQQHAASHAVGFIHALYAAYFTGNIDISDLDTVIRIAGEIGIASSTLREALNGEAIKDALKEKVAAAVAHNVFGSPFIIVDGEPFWGFDRFDQLKVLLRDGRI